MIYCRFIESCRAEEGLLEEKCVDQFQAGIYWSCKTLAMYGTQK